MNVDEIREEMSELIDRIKYHRAQPSSDALIEMVETWSKALDDEELHENCLPVGYECDKCSELEHDR